MLEIKNMSCGYGGKDIVKNISFTVSDGEKLCILGPNGCGKTTVLRALSGMIPYSGSIKLRGKELKSLSRRKISEALAMLSQLSSANYSYSVYDAVLMGRYLKQKGMSGIFKSSASDKEAVDNCLKRLGLLKIRDKSVTELSGGQLQRVFLARALVQEPSVLILDEPTNHLDISYQLALINLINSWTAEKQNRTVIGVIHELNLCPELFDRAVLLSDGEIVLNGKTADVLKSGELSAVYGADIAGHMRKSGEFWLK